MYVEGGIGIGRRRRCDHHIDHGRVNTHSWISVCTQQHTTISYLT